jgi:hypothetical protein
MGKEYVKKKERRYRYKGRKGVRNEGRKKNNSRCISKDVFLWYNIKFRSTTFT